MWFPHKIAQDQFQTKGAVGEGSQRVVPERKLRAHGLFMREEIPRREHPTIDRLSIATYYVRQVYHTLVIYYHLDGFQIFP